MSGESQRVFRVSCARPFTTGMGPPKFPNPRSGDSPVNWTVPVIAGPPFWTGLTATVNVTGVPAYIVAAEEVSVAVVPYTTLTVNEAGGEAA